jgi:type 1 glutamine amidotransferase
VDRSSGTGGLDEKGGRVFYTSLGHVEDFALPALRRLLVNGIFWTLDKPVPD